MKKTHQSNKYVWVIGIALIALFLWGKEFARAAATQLGTVLPHWHSNSLLPHSHWYGHTSEPPVVTPKIHIDWKHIDPTGVSFSDGKLFSKQTNHLAVTAQLGNDSYYSEQDELLLSIGLEGLGGAVTQQERRPLDIALVIDRSGSMSGEKLSSVKSALLNAANYFQEGDIISIVVYDDTAQTILEPASFNESQYLAAVKRVESGGSTNIEAGISTGFDHLRRSDRSNQHMLLLSDGLANTGIQTPSGLASLVDQAQLRNEQLVVSTIGVGSDYDEKIMAAIAQAGDGNYLFMESVSQAETIIGSELTNATSVVAQDISVTLNLENGFVVERGLDFKTIHGSSFSAQDLSAKEKNEYLLQLKSTKHLASGTQRVGSIQVEYSTPSGEHHRLELPLEVEVTQDPVAVLQNKGVYEQYVNAYLADQQQRVYQDLDNDDNAAAQEKIGQTRSFLMEANTVLNGAFDSEVTVLRKQELEVENFGSSSARTSSQGRSIIRSFQSESADTLYNK